MGVSGSMNCTIARGVAVNGGVLKTGQIRVRSLESSCRFHVSRFPGAHPGTLNRPMAGDQAPVEASLTPAGAR